MDFGSIVSKAKSHPVETGLIVFVVGLGGLYAFGFFSSGSGNSGSGNSGAGAQAYFGAVAAQGISGNDLQATQDQDQTAVQIAGIQANSYDSAVSTFASVYNNEADVSLQEAQLAPEIAGINALATVASLPPTVTSSKSNGFFGIGGSTKQTITPNPASGYAIQSIQNFLTGTNVNH